MNLETIADWQ